MAATMQLGVVNPQGLAQIFVEIRDRRTKAHIKQGTGLYINHLIWEKRNDEKALDKYIKNPEITKKRMFFETMEKVMPDLKIVIPSGDNEVQTFYPLESFTGNTETTTAAE